MLDFKNDVSEIAGWLTETEGFFLYKTARKVSRQNAIVEIGSWKGRSTICLGKGVEDGNKAKIYAIDPHIGSPKHHKMFGRVDTYQEFVKNIKKANIDQNVQPIRKTSEEASKYFNELVEFIYIDGAHKLNLVSLDFKLWFPKVIHGGIVAFHDSWYFHGPNIVTTKILLTSSEIKNPRLIDTITCFEKVNKNSILDRFKNIIFLLYRTFFWG